MIFIGKNLDRAALTAAFDACLVGGGGGGGGEPAVQQEAKK